MHEVIASAASPRERATMLFVTPIDFDGRSDALMHAFTADGTRHMEYVGTTAPSTTYPWTASWRRSTRLTDLSSPPPQG